MRSLSYPSRSILVHATYFPSDENCGFWSTDWYDAIASFQSRGNNAYVSYDNLPIKAYVYPWSQVEKIHDLSNRVPAPGGEAAVCPEDGYTLLDIAG